MSTTIQPEILHIAVKEMESANMPHDLLHRKLEQIIQPVADLKGEVFYSAAECLKKGDTYLLGYNPGQGGPDTTIGKHLATSIERTDNAWLDESWGGTRPSNLQRRMWRLFDDAGLDLRATASSNLIFATSPDASGIDCRLAEVCWPAHLAIIDIIKPSKLVVFGNGEEESPYAFIRANYRGAEERFEYGNRRRLKRLETVIGSRPTSVIGLMHPSRFVPPTEAADWLRRE
jgi:hypothetical protein